MLCRYKMTHRPLKAVVVGTICLARHRVTHEHLAHSHRLEIVIGACHHAHRLCFGPASQHNEQPSKLRGFTVFIRADASTISVDRHNIPAHSSTPEAAARPAAFGTWSTDSRSCTACRGRGFLEFEPDLCADKRKWILDFETVSFEVAGVPTEFAHSVLKHRQVGVTAGRAGAREATSHGHERGTRIEEFATIAWRTADGIGETLRIKRDVQTWSAESDKVGVDEDVDDEKSSGSSDRVVRGSEVEAIGLVCVTEVEVLHSEGDRGGFVERRIALVHPEDVRAVFSFGPQSVEGAVAEFPQQRAGGIIAYGAAVEANSHRDTLGEWRAVHTADRDRWTGTHPAQSDGCVYHGLMRAVGGTAGMKKVTMDGRLDPDALEIALGVECRASRGTFTGGVAGDGSIAGTIGSAHEDGGQSGASAGQGADLGLKCGDAEFGATYIGVGGAALLARGDDGMESFARGEFAQHGDGIGSAQSSHDAARGGLVDTQLCDEFSDSWGGNTDAFEECSHLSADGGGRPEC